MGLENSFIPRAFSVTDSRRRQEELARKQQALDGASRAGASTIPPGGTLRLEGGIEVQGGNITVRDDGEITAAGQGRDRYSGTPITVRTSLANRQVIDEWTGAQVLRPGIYVDASNNPRDPANVASVFSRYGDDLNVQSAVSSIDNSVEDWKSSLNAAPAGVALVWAAADRTISPAAEGRNLRSGSIGVDVDGGGGISTYARTRSDITDPTIQHITVNSEARAYGGQLGPAQGAKLSVTVQDYQWNAIERSWIRVDRDGILQLHSVKAGGGTVDVSHNGDGVLNLAGSSRVNVNGNFTVNGSPVGGAVTSVAGKTGDVVLAGSDIPAATTSAQGAMTAADKTALDRLNTDQILAPLTPSGWTVEGDFYVQPVGAKQKVEFSLKCIRTGAAIAVTAGTYVTVGAVIPTNARSTVGVQTYAVAWLLGGSAPVLGTIFINPNSGQLLFTSSTNMTFGTNFSFTISHTYTK